MMDQPIVGRLHTQDTLARFHITGGNPTRDYDSRGRQLFDSCEHTDGRMYMIHRLLVVKNEQTAATQRSRRSCR
jgi:hypothetical protein